MTTRIAFFADVLSGAGWPGTVESLQALVAVAVGEGSTAKWNPTDTILFEAGATPFNTFGPNGEYHVWNFPDQATGVKATVATLQGWPAVAAAFASGEPASDIVTLIDAADGVGGTLYADVLAGVVSSWPADGNILVSGSGPTPPPAPPITQGVPDMIIVQATGDTAVYLVGGVPPVKYHLSPVEEQALLAFGVPAKRDQPAALVAAIPVAGGGPVVTSEVAAQSDSAAVEPVVGHDEVAPAVEVATVPAVAEVVPDPALATADPSVEADAVAKLQADLAERNAPAIAEAPAVVPSYESLASSGLLPKASPTEGAS